MTTSGPLFLGLDSSTQALKASLLTPNLAVLSEVEVRFDRDLPHFGTVGGVLKGPEGSGEVFSPVMQPIEALDLLFERIREKGWDVGRIRGVSGSGQQHASVYWCNDASALLSSLDGNKPMAPQLADAFSRAIIPNWQDSSTEAECAALAAAVGGPEELARITGSSAHTRFTGAQIMKFRQQEPEAYAQTWRISLVSSLITTLLCADGEVKGIDESDACGMNLWDMSRAQRGWNEVLLSTVAGSESAGEDLAAKLGAVETDGGRVVGHIGRWFQDRYGFSPDCVVVPGTGDNPATFLSFVLREKEGLISLGTSDVVLVSTSAYNPHPEFHAFFHPAQIAPDAQQGAGGVKGAESEGMRYFNMLVYKNGSLVREHVRDKYFDKDWDQFNAAAERLRPTSAEGVPDKTAFWWLLPDIIPAGAHGTFKYVGRDAATAQSVPAFDDVGSEALAILESQMLNYRSRSSAILSPPSASASSAPTSETSDTRLARVYATGGAARNPSICNVMSDVLGCPVSKRVEYDEGANRWCEADWNACSVGVGYKAAWGYARHLASSASEESAASTPEFKDVTPSTRFDDFVAACTALRRAELPAKAATAEGAPGSDGAQNVAVPRQPAAYDAAVQWWKALEARALSEMA